MKNVAVFASGNGTNFQALVDAKRNNQLAGKVSLLISDKPTAFVNERAKKAGIPVFAFEPKKYNSKADYEQIIVDILREYNIDLIVLAGYMRIVGTVVLSSYHNKIINLHPSLLPAFPGRDAIAQAISYGVKVTGITVHFVDEGMDTGPIILQRVIAIEENEKIEALTARIHSLEHETLIKAVNLILQDKVVIDKRIIIINEENS